MQLVPCLGDAKGSIVKLPDSFIFRCLVYESWDTLKIFLTEFKKKAENVMHRGNFDITPLVAFIVVSRMEIQETGMFKKKSGNFSEIDEIIRLFLDCGADMKEPTKIGSAEQFLRM